jgi:hypothetical protein
VNDDEIGKACSIHRRGEIQGFGSKSRRIEATRKIEM